MDLFNDSRHEAVQLLDEYTRLTTVAPQTRRELRLRMWRLYQAHVADADWEHFMDAFCDAISCAHLLRINEVILLEIGVHGDNQIINSDSSLSSNTQIGRAHV